MPSSSSPLRPQWQERSQTEFRRAYKALESPQDLASLWGVPASQIAYYAFKAPKHDLYTSFAIPRRHGAPRHIEAPNPTLRYLQRIIHESLTCIYGPHRAVHGFRAGRSIVTNAKCHVDSRYVLNIDLSDFFHSVTRQRIYGRLITAPYELDTKVANIVASLATNSLGTLPQGSPSSPILANMIAAQMDDELSRFATSRYCVYTRYADDITISTKRQVLSPQIARYPHSRGTGQAILGDALVDTIERHGFTINNRKTRLQSHSTRQLCTGLVVNGKSVSVPRRYVRRLRSLIDHWSKNGWKDAASALAAENGRPHFTERRQLVNHVRGRLDYLRMVCGHSDPVCKQMRDRFEAIPESH